MSANLVWDNGCTKGNLTPFSLQAPIAARMDRVLVVPNGEAGVATDLKIHSNAALYISLLIVDTKYTGWCENDFSVYG